jgi:hypothetical protein
LAVVPSQESGVQEVKNIKTLFWNSCQHLYLACQEAGPHIKNESKDIGGQNLK